MSRLAICCLLSVSLAMTAESPAANADEDPFRWLEAVDSRNALAWVRGMNALTVAEFTTDADFAALQQRLRAILDADDNIPWVSVHGAQFYNFWRDAEHPRGLWRRIDPTAYAAGDDAAWETILDLDALAASEGENWVWAGVDVLDPEAERAMVELSRGGADATVVREFDLVAKRFVPDGFTLPEAKTGVTWIDRNTLLVATDFGADSLTESGYPRQVRRWRRGQPLGEAEVVFTAPVDSVSAWPAVWRGRGYRHVGVNHSPTFFTDQVHLLTDEGLAELAKPADARLQLYRDQAIITPRSDWRLGDSDISAGSLVAVPLSELASDQPTVQVLFHAGERSALEDLASTSAGLVLVTLDELTPQLHEWRLSAEGTWHHRRAPAPTTARVAVRGHDPFADPADASYQLIVTGFLTPTTYQLAPFGSDDRVDWRSQPARFDHRGLRAERFQAISADGTRVPYTVVAPADQLGTTPLATYLYAYGGFEVSLTPWYPAATGAAWLERGHAFVVANIRGGGEFGPAWHQAALREHRPRAFEDCAAVAADLVERGITTPQQLGMGGGSNGGLLAGVMLTRYPERFGAIVSSVPLLDMRRYHELLAGASWMEEYGDPDDPAQWAHMRTWSPYHNVTAEATYPPTLFVTSTRDDRVHPAHARKMVARLNRLGHQPWSYENIEGGHGAAADNAQRAFIQALTYRFLERSLVSEPSPDAAGE